MGLCMGETGNGIPLHGIHGEIPGADPAVQEQTKGVSKEALLAEDGILDSHLGAEIVTKSNVEAHPRFDIKVTGPYDDQEDCCQDQLQRSKQYCGICKKIWRHSDGGNWVCCDGCNVWVHAECDKMSSKLLKDLEHTDYYCPDCKTKVNCKLAESRSSSSKINSIEKKQEHMVPEEVKVVCIGMEGIYIPSLHSVMCKCGSCGSRKRTLGEWERHTDYQEQFSSWSFPTVGSAAGTCLFAREV